MNSQWNIMRFVRAGLAGWAFWEVFHTGEWLLLIPGGIFALQAILNVGCCGSGACYSPPSGQRTTEPETVTYEEVR